MTTVNYPAWQNTLRASQAVVNAKLAEETERQRQEQETKNAAQRTKDAESLKRMLALFGIDADPVDNEWVADGYHFSLQRMNTYADGRSDTVREWEHQEARQIRFVLRVADGNDGGMHDKIDYSGSIEDDWTPLQARLADILDKLAAQRASRLAWIAEQERAEAARERKRLDKLPTLSEQLESLIRRIVRQEISADEF